MIKLIVILLEKFCTLTHRLPPYYDEKLQCLFIRVLGYHCPFALWSYWLDKQFDLKVWKETDAGFSEKL